MAQGGPFSHGYRDICPIWLGWWAARIISIRPENQSLGRETWVSTPASSRRSSHSFCSAVGDWPSDMSSTTRRGRAEQDQVGEPFPVPGHGRHPVPALGQPGAEEGRHPAPVVGQAQHTRLEFLLRRLLRQAPSVAVNPGYHVGAPSLRRGGAADDETVDESWRRLRPAAEWVRVRPLRRPSRPGAT